MGFRFPLDAVLRIREIDEQREERLLSQILAQVNQTRESIAAADRQIAEASATREKRLSARMTAAELLGAYGVAAMLKERKQFTQQQLVQFELLRDKQIKTYQAAHQDRELLSNTRQEHRQRFVAAQSRQQQKSLDDMFLARMKHR